MDRLFRLAYRCAYALLRVWWFVRRPSARGAAVAIWQDDALLLVRTSYREQLDLPGGTIDRGETPRAAAVRELREETGIAVEPDALAEAGRFAFREHHRRIEAFVCPWRPDRPVRPEVDRREIVWAGFVPRAELAVLPLGPVPRLYLEALGDQVPSGTRQMSRA